MIPNAFRIHCNNIILNFTKMLLLRTLEYYQLVLCEVSRLYVKKWLRKTPLEIKFVRKKYNGENGLQRKAILCGGIPGQIKNISDINTFYN